MRIAGISIFNPLMLVNELRNKNVGLIVLVAALGYFVDIYDLVLFGMERVRSLTDILTTNYPHLAEAANKAELDGKLKDYGIFLLNTQMIGMLAGGIFWGILGDKKGRLSVLFGSILLYSLANIANGLVEDTTTYAIMRFISGFGLAGELGAGITLVSESMSKQMRGWGAMIVASVGLSGAVVAGIVGNFIDSWRVSYFIGGGMGLVLLLLRIGVYESGMFSHVKKSNVSRGNFFALFRSSKNLVKFFSIILIALPVWYVMGILITLCKEMGQAFGMAEIPVPRTAITLAYVGITIGDVVSGWVSQKLQSRKKALLYFLSLVVFSITIYFLFGKFHSVFGDYEMTAFYAIVILIGFATGYWAVFMVTASELFGTNIRATVTTTAPNFVRGGTVLITYGFMFLAWSFGSDGKPANITGAILIGVIVMAAAFWALSRLEETFHKDLDYVEEEHPENHLQ